MNSDHAINHCGMVGELQDANVSREDFQEAVMERTGAIVTEMCGGETTERHQHQGVELVANVIAREVTRRGAEMVCSDMGVDLSRLIELAKSEHISSC